jgi:MFS family permease
VSTGRHGTVRNVRFDALAPLRNRPFARLWTGAFVSNIGTWMETVAIGIYVTETTGKASWTGAVAAAGFVPTAVLGPVGGALADRAARKRVLIGTTIVQTVLAALLTILFVNGEPSPAVVTAIVFAGGCAMALGFPAYQAMLPDLVPPEDLPGAIGLSSAQWNLGRVIGPAIAGIVIGTSHRYALALGLNAVSFFAVLAVVATLVLPRPDPRATEQRLFHAIVDGLRYVRAEPGLRVNVLTMCVTVFLAAPFIALVPAMAIEVLDSGAGGTSLLVTAQGVGAVATGVAVGPLAARFGVRRVMVSALACLPLALVAYALAPRLGLSALAILVVGGCYLAALSSFSTVAQTRAPVYLRGRVLGVNIVVLGTLYPIGAIVQGALADQVGLRVTTAASGVALAAVLLTARALRPGITEILEAPVEADAAPGVGGPAIAPEIA